MKTMTFLGFVAPSVVAMLLLIALPLVGVVYLALHSSYVKTELVEERTDVPIFGGAVQQQVTIVPKPVIGPDGKVAKVFPRVKVDGHVEKVLEAI